MINISPFYDKIDLNMSKIDTKHYAILNFGQL